MTLTNEGGGGRGVRWGLCLSTSLCMWCLIYMASIHTCSSIVVGLKTILLMEIVFFKKWSAPSDSSKNSGLEILVNTISLRTVLRPTIASCLMLLNEILINQIITKI